LKEGILIWNEHLKRLDIAYSDGQCYGGLHCGDVVETMVENAWRHVRVEYCDSSGHWFLVGRECGSQIFGLPVRN